MKKGVSTIISFVLLLLISVIAVYLALNVVKPTVERVFESAAMNEAELNIQILDNLIREVASEGTGSLRSVVLKVSDGEYRIINTSGNFTGAIQFEIELKHSPYTAPMLKRVGNLKYSVGINPLGLVGYWNFNERNGTFVADSSGYGNDGTLYNESVICSGGDCPTWIDGKYGSALSFDGANDYVNVGTGSGLDLTEAFTLEMWYKPISIQTGTKTIVGRGLTTSDVGGYAIKIEDGKFRGYFYDSSWHYTPLSSITASPGTWYHIVLTYDKANLKLYLNGNLDSSTQFTSPVNAPTNAVLNFGRWTNGSQYTNGIIDELKIYSRALTGREVKENYDAKASNYQVALEYNKIIITGNLKLGKGTHKLCIEKIGELNNKPLIKITAC
jgi:hypothetical protein